MTPLFLGSMLKAMKSRPQALVTRGWLLIFNTAMLLACASQSLADRSTGQNERSAPPATLACDINQLTSFDGLVTHYQRDVATTSITIDTDWDTVESLTIKHPGPQGLLQYLKLDGRQFKEKDWPLIESGPGILIEGMRAVVWVCLDEETQAVIDWRPGTGAPGLRNR